VIDSSEDIVGEEGEEGGLTGIQGDGLSLASTSYACLFGAGLVFVCFIFFFFILFFSLWYWGLDSEFLPLQPHPPVFVVFLVCFSDRVMHFCWGQPQTMILLSPLPE
jgi:hypothetical protein